MTFQATLLLITSAGFLYGYLLTVPSVLCFFYAQYEDYHTTVYNLSAPAYFGEYEETNDYAAAWKAGFAAGGVEGGAKAIREVKYKEYFWALPLMFLPWIGGVLLISAWTTFEAAKNNRYQMQTIIHDLAAKAAAQAAAASKDAAAAVATANAAAASMAAKDAAAPASAAT